jgi:hypothetical protein
MDPEAFYLQSGSVYLVPVCHYRMEFAWAVHQAFLAVQPQRIALELPSFLGPAYQKAVARFPHLSIIAYEVDGQTMLLPVEPTDAFAEAARGAAEQKLAVHYIDLNVKGYSPQGEPSPDSSSLGSIGLARFWEQYSQLPPHSYGDDLLREEHMVLQLHSLTKLYPNQKILAVCGIDHAAAILRGLEQRSGEGRVFDEIAPPAEINVYEPDLDSIRQIACEMPLVMAHYEMDRGGPGPEETWVSPKEDDKPEPVDKNAGVLEQISRQDVFASIEALLGLRKKIHAPKLTNKEVKAVADYLNRLQAKPQAWNDLLQNLITGKAQQSESFELPTVPPPTAFKAFKFRQVSDRRELLREHYLSVWMQATRTPVGPDRQRMLVEMTRQAASFYHDNTGETFKPWQEQILYQFSRNYARLHGRLLPGLFELVMAARGVADDNFSYEVWDLSTFYPWSEGTGDVPTIRLDADQLFLGDRRVQQWTFHRRLPRMRQTMQRIPIRKRAEEENPGEWGDEFKNGSLCSYPPEDIVIEDYGRYLQAKALSLLSQEQSRVEPFSTSLLDGIDMRETLRNWHEQKIYVRESRKIKGGVGAVVIIFDQDDKEDRYPWKMTWHGEHAQESDMAFYATPVTAKIVGPGIARCEYGGLMLSYPYHRLANVWGDPLYSECQTKDEVLLMAALDYSLEKHVVYVAKKAPRSTFRTMAARLGKKIVYIPSGQLSPQSLHRIRVFHVLSGHRIRKIARDYIW